MIRATQKWKRVMLLSAHIRQVVLFAIVCISFRSQDVSALEKVEWSPAAKAALQHNARTLIQHYKANRWQGPADALLHTLGMPPVNFGRLPAGIKFTQRSIELSPGGIWQHDLPLRLAYSETGPATTNVVLSTPRCHLKTMSRHPTSITSHSAGRH